MSREAFEAHIERMTGERPFMIGGTYNNVGWRKSWEDWQAAIQHARDVAAEIVLRELDDNGQARAIKDAIKAGQDVPGCKLVRGARLDIK